jgi:5-methyltetrahydropteroyltriglutamate--homocysteine methyltransferase
MTVASNLGFPRIGHRRELKTALEWFWLGDLDEAALEAAAETLRARHWAPCNVSPSPGATAG